MEKHLIKLIGMLLISFFIISCEDCPNWPASKPYIATFRFEPEKRVFHIGDTLYFASEIPVLELFNHKDATDIMEVNSQLTCRKLIYNDSIQLPYAALDFKGFVEVGERVLEDKLIKNNILFFNYAVTGDSLKAKVGIIPLKKGDYTISPWQILIRPKNAGNCLQETLALIQYHNNMNNIDMMDSIGIQNMPIESIKAPFCFSVVD